MTPKHPGGPAPSPKLQRAAGEVIEESPNRGQLRFNIISESARSRGEKLLADVSETGAGTTRKSRFAVE